MLQHEPWGQLPHTVFLFAAPHDPSVVTTPVVVPEGVGVPRTGSAVLVEATLVVDVDPSVQPLTQPLAFRQCDVLFPHHPLLEQQPPYSPFASHVAPPYAGPQRPSSRGAVGLAVVLQPDWHPSVTRQIDAARRRRLDQVYLRSALTTSHTSRSRCSKGHMCRSGRTAAHCSGSRTCHRWSKVHALTAQEQREPVRRRWNREDPHHVCICRQNRRLGHAGSQSCPQQASRTWGRNSGGHD